MLRYVRSVTIRVRRVAAACALGAALTACGAPSAPHASRPAPSAPTAAVSRPPTLAPGPAGLTPVFKNGPREDGKTVALTFDADMTADEGRARRRASTSTIRS